MATLALGTLLKVGAVVVVTGASIATPIFLSKKGDTPFTSTSNSSSGDFHSSDSLKQSESTISSEETISSNSESPQRSRTDSDSPSQISPETSSASTPATSERFEKTCFEVPTNYKNGEEGIKLLTCFDTKNSENEHREENPAYDSQFHLYDPSQNSIPLKIEGNLYWESEGKQITARMKKETGETGKEYIFIAKGDEWSRVSTNLKIDLLEKNQCEIYKVTSVGSEKIGTFWLSCADNTNETFDPNSPTAIPLTSWTNNQFTVR